MFDEYFVFSNVSILEVDVKIFILRLVIIK